MGVVLAVNVEEVKGRNMSNVCSFYAFMNNKVVLYCRAFITSCLHNYSQDMVSIVYYEENLTNRASCAFIYEEILSLQRNAATYVLLNAGIIPC